MNNKILCTGNPNIPGIANSLQKIYSDTTFISRSSGYNLLTPDGLIRFRSIIKDYNIFVNHSQLPPNGQKILLDIVSQEWNSGHIITIGSVLEFEKWSWIDPQSAESKKKLKEQSLNLLTEKLKTSYVIVGGLKSNDGDHMRLSPESVVETIKFIIESKFNVPLLYVDHISDELTEYWKNKKINVRITNIDL